MHEGYQRAMLTISGNTRIFLYGQPVHMGKSFEGLSVLVEQAFPEKILSGALFIFSNRRKDQIKILYWDKDGFAIWRKRLEKGTFSWEWGKEKEINRTKLLMILEGVIPKRLKKRYRLS